MVSVPNDQIMDTEQPDNALKILNKGSDYFRQRVLRRDAEIKKQHRKSAVELLDESKNFYVKSESVRDSKQLPKHAENLQVGCRRRVSACADVRKSVPPAVPPKPTHRNRRSVSLTEGHSYHRVRANWPPSQTHELHRVSGLAQGTAPNGSLTDVVDIGTFPHQNGRSTLSSMEYVASHSDTACERCKSSEPGAGSSAKPASPARLRCSHFYVKNGDLKKEGTGSTSDLTKPMPTILAGDEWRDTRTDTSSEVDGRSNTSSLVKGEEHALAVVRRRVKKAIHRSRSDLAKRYSNSSDLSELSARFSRNSADLEKFFNEMGLDKSVLEPMLSNQCAFSSSDLHLFESCSSLDSPDDRSICSDVEDLLLPADSRLKSSVVEERAPTQTSIVERNARIIKWLCSVKKANSQEEVE